MELLEKFLLEIVVELMLYWMLTHVKQTPLVQPVSQVYTMKIKKIVMCLYKLPIKIAQSK